MATIYATFEVKTLNRIPAENDKPLVDVVKCAHVRTGDGGGPDGYSELRLRIDDPEVVGRISVGSRLSVAVSVE